MPKRRVRTAAQIRASRKNLEKARAAKVSRARYTGKSGLPHVGWEVKKNGLKGVVVRARTYNKAGDITGELFGEILPIEVWSKDKNKSNPLSFRKGKTLVVSDVSKLTKKTLGKSIGYSINDYSNGGKRSSSASLEPGASLLTAAVRAVGPRNPMKVTMAVKQAKPFYLLTGGKPANGSALGSWSDMIYGPAARKKLAGRRIVRVRYK